MKLRSFMVVFAFALSACAGVRKDAPKEAAVPTPETWRTSTAQGTSPASLPAKPSTKFEFVIDLRTARTLGLDVPPTLLARGDRIAMLLLCCMSLLLAPLRHADRCRRCLLLGEDRK